MNRKEYWLMLMLAVVAGMVGGAMSSRIFIGVPVFAQKPAEPAKVITAEEFRLIDKDGKLRAMLYTPDKDVVALFLNDREEKIKARMAVVGGRRNVVPQ